MKKVLFLFLLVVCLSSLTGCELYQYIHKHEYTDKVVAPTCTEKGYTKHTCECGDTYNDSDVDAKGHSYGEWVVVKEATEEAVGSKERACSVCGNKETETIAKLDHTHKYTDTVVEPTCTEDGYIEHKCECGHSYKDNEVKASHKEVVIEGKEATCTEDGLTEGKKCSVCNEVLVEQETVEATGHLQNEEWIKNAKTHYKGYKCCGDKTTEEEVHTFISNECTICGFKPLINVSNVNYANEEEVEILISISDNPGIVGLEITINYDQNFLELCDAINGDALNVLNYSSSNSLDSGCRFLWDGLDLASNEIQDGLVLKLIFIVKSDIPNGKYDIIVKTKAYDLNIDTVSFCVKNGAIIVE